MKSEICYVVKLKFTYPEITTRENRGNDGEDIFLGDCGKWCSRCDARRFSTVKAAENELLCNVNRLRRQGLEAATLAVVPVWATNYAMS